MSVDHTFTGNCIGGPLDGENLTVNASKGFVLVDLDRDVVTVYDFGTVELQFTARETEKLDENKLGAVQVDPEWSILVDAIPIAGEAEDIAEWEDDYPDDYSDWEAEGGVEGRG